jgi:hypothetical protein
MNELSAAECAEELENQEKSLCSRCDNNPCGCHNPKKFCKSIVVISQSAAVMRKLAAGEIAEVVHAKWITYKRSYIIPYPGIDEYKCSNCGCRRSTKSKYCKDCGALMGKDDNNAE